MTKESHKAVYAS